MWYCYAFLSVVATVHLSSVVFGVENSQRNVGDVERNILIKIFKSYEKSIRAYPDDGGPTEVDVNCFVRSISSINEISMEYTVDLLVRQYWNDPRLQYNTTDDANITYLKTSPDIRARLWTPDLFFPVERRGNTHTITVPNTMIRIYPNGNLLYTERYSLTLACDMNLEKYPFDVQYCILQMGSFSNTVESLIFRWVSQNPITVNRNMRLPKFNLSYWETLPCSNVHVTGNFSCLRSQFVFKRQLGFHLVESYLPTTLLVMASWLGFWIDAGSVPGRVALAVTTMLTTVAQSTNIKHTLPPVSYVKAIDIWLGVCTTYVFMALAEFALVNYLSQCDDLFPPKSVHHSDEPVKNNLGKRQKGLKGDLGDIETPMIPKSISTESKLKRGLMISKKVDRVSRALFPITFCIFAVVYLWWFAS